MLVEASHSWRERVTIAAAAAATLAVIAGPPLAASISGAHGFGENDPPASTLTERAEKALAELPFAYRLGESVIVPAATDFSVNWSGTVVRERIVGQAIPLGFRGVTDYGYLSSSALAPDWTAELTAEDRVLADVGPLTFACTRWPGVEGCEASLLMQHEGEYYFFRSGIGSADFLEEGAPMEMFTFDVLGPNGTRQLVLGGLGGTETKEVQLTLRDGSTVAAWASRGVAVEGATIWWTSVSSPVESVSAYDGRGDVVQRLGPG